MINNTKQNSESIPMCFSRGTYLWCWFTLLSPKLITHLFVGSSHFPVSWKILFNFYLYMTLELAKVFAGYSPKCCIIAWTAVMPFLQTANKHLFINILKNNFNRQTILLLFIIHLHKIGLPNSSKLLHKVAEPLFVEANSKITDSLNEWGIFM